MAQTSFLPGASIPYHLDGRLYLFGSIASQTTSQITGTNWFGETLIYRGFFPDAENPGQWRLDRVELPGRITVELGGASQSDYLVQLLGGGDDRVEGNELDNLLIGENVSDGNRRGEFGDDILLGYAGSDTFIPGPGNDHMDGGSGFDWFSQDSSINTGMIVNMSSASVSALSLVNEVSIVANHDYSVWFPRVTTESTLAGSTSYHSLGGLDTLVGIEGTWGTSYDDVIVAAGATPESANGFGPGGLAYGGDGRDVLFFSVGTAFVSGGNDDDLIIGNTGNDLANGDAGNDFMFGREGDDTLNGLEGFDFLFGGAGNDRIFGGADDDYSEGGDGDDEIYSDDGNDTAFGGGGNDILGGWLGDDHLSGGDGNDELYGDDGNDELYGDGGNDRLFGGSGDDYSEGGDGDDEIYSDDGNDTVVGGGGNDILGGWLGDDHLSGGDGNDELYGDDGNDQLYGDAGNDIIQAGNGNNYSEGGDGDDEIYNGDGNDSSYGGSGADLIYGWIGDDQLFGEAGEDWLEGYVGSDLLDGGSESDFLDGGAGTDVILGGAGSDTLVGGYSLGGSTVIDDFDVDQLEGGEGIDFYFAGVGDTIAELEVNESVELLGTANIATHYYIYRSEGSVFLGAFSDSIIPTTVAEILTDLDPRDIAMTVPAGGNGLFTRISGAPSSQTYAREESIAEGVEELKRQVDGFASRANIGQVPDVFTSESLGKIAKVLTEEFLTDPRLAKYVPILGTLVGFQELIQTIVLDYWYGYYDDRPLGQLERTAAYASALAGLAGPVANITFQVGTYFVLELVKDVIDVYGGALQTLQVLIPEEDGTVVPEDAPEVIVIPVEDESASIEGNLENFDGDTVVNFDEDDRLVFENASFGAEALTVTYGSAILKIDADLDGVVDATITLEGDYEGATFDVETIGGNVEISVTIPSPYSLTEGSALSETLVGDSGQNRIQGLAGEDRLLGLAGDDFLEGGADNDRLNGGAGNDRIDGDDGEDRVYAGTGNDLVNGGNDDDLLVGEQGNDTLNGDAGNDILRGGDGIDIINGGAGDDTAFGGNDDDTLLGGTGNDTLDGSGGDDLVDGGIGDDLLVGETGSDVLLGREGADTMRGGGGNDELDGGDDDDLMFGSSGEDTMFGGNGDDTMEGNQQSDDLFGQNGNDILRGGDGFDFLNGGSGNDILAGGNGNDVLVGGLGVDTLRGNAQADIFVFSSTAESSAGSSDLVDGIDGIGVVGGDMIDVSGIDADETIAGNQGFTFLGAVSTAAGLAAGPGALWVEEVGGQTRVHGNIDGDNTIDLLIRINDGSSVTPGDYLAGDFVL